MTCEEGNFLTPSKTCAKCDSNCRTCLLYSTYCSSCNDKTCSAANVCSTCISNNYFLLNGICYECNKNCKTLETDNCKCESCQDGYYLSNYQCLKCNSNCKTCQNTATNCLTCIDGNYLTASKTCAKCDSNCKTCSNSATRCLSCNKGYDLLSSNICVLCPEPCKTCSAENICSSCLDNYFFHLNECYDCKVNCKTLESDNCKCKSCDDGYYLHNFQCLKCHSNCRTCTDSATNCVTCEDGNYLTSFNTCDNCIEPCKTCINSASTCLSCIKGYDIISNNICVPCEEPCKTCSAENICSSCIDNYFFLPNECYQCNINCKTKQNDNCKCASCEDGYYLYNYQCLKCNSNCKTCLGTDTYCLTCDEGFYLTDNNICTECIEPCKTCLSETKCLSCIDDYFLIGNQCNKCNYNCKTSSDKCKCTSCDRGYYFNNYQCLNCDSNCKTCSNKADYCTSCDINKYLNEHKCLDCDESCNNKDMDTNKKDEEEKYYDEVLENVDSIFTSEYYDTSSIDNGNEEVMEIDKMKIVLTTTDNQKNSNNENMTSIDLGECETLLKEYYNITNEKIYMKKVDIIQENMQIPKIEFEVYSRLNGSNLVKLNLSICETSKISMSIPVDISEDLDKLNTSSDYYNSVCYTATSENGTDISLKDRQKEFVEQNKAVCQEDCDLNDYNYTTKKANCSCKTKESPLSFSDMHINKTKLYNNFMDIKNIANVNILKCYNNLIKKEGLLYNIGSYIIIVILIFHIICIIIFYAKQYSHLKKKIKDIVYAIKNLALVKRKNNNKIKDKKAIKKLKSNHNNKKYYINNYKNKNNTKSIQLKDSTKTKKSNQIIETINPSNGGNNFINYILNNYHENKHKNKSNKKNIKLPIMNKSIIQKLPQRQKGANKITNQKSNKKKKKTKLTKMEKIKKILKFRDQEKNLLDYKIALIHDKRKYCKYYKSLLKTQHEFIFSFIYKKDYNSRIVKIDLYFVSFVIYYAVNGLFFDDNTMHKIYENNGSFDLESQITKIIYSSIISMVINKILGLLALSSAAIIKFKENKNKNNVNVRKRELKKSLNIKFALYFILSFLFLLAFWYYIAMFGAIYRNTQIHLLKDTLISFGLSLIYPFIIYLFPGIFRIPSLSNPKAKRKCLYDFSKLLQAL